MVVVVGVEVEAVRKRERVISLKVDTGCRDRSEREGGRDREKERGREGGMSVREE
jgi:hypothetical protein